MVDYDPDYIFWTNIYMASSWLIVIQCSLQIFHVFKGGVCFGWAVVVLGVVRHFFGLLHQLAESK